MTRVAVSLRFDRDVADMLRKRAERDRCSVNRLVNDGMRQYLTAPVTLAGVTAHVLMLQRAIAQLSIPQETQEDINLMNRQAWKAAEGLLTLLAAKADPAIVPLVGDVKRTKAGVKTQTPALRSKP